MASEFGLFEQLLAFKWRDVEIPVTKMTMTIAHDLVEHKYWGVDGSDIEAVGLAPTRFTATIPLTNAIYPGKNERWKAAELYPDGLRKLVTAFAKKADGTLQHPEFGDVICKAERLTIDWDAMRRGGCDCEASWIETGIEQVTTFAPSPVQQIFLAGLNLDASSADIKKLAPDFPQYKTTFADLARSLQAIGDQVTLLSYRGAGQINSVLYRVNAMQASLSKAKSALTWPLIENCERVRAATFDLKDKILAGSGNISFFITKSQVTIAGLAITTGNKVSDLITLNPSLMSKPTIAKDVRVRYYQAA